MKKLMNRWIMAGMLAVALLLAASVASADHSWGSYHWARTSNPFTLKLVDSVKNNGANWNNHLSVASTDWSGSNVLDTAIVAGSEDGKLRKQCPAVKGQIRVCNALYGFNGWLGLAQIWISGNHIYQGTAKMNDSYMDNPKFITPYETPAWRQFVMCQEIGHPFGLDHQDVTFDNANLGSCMDYTDDPDGTTKDQLSNLHPNSHDYDQLATIYTHLDSNNTFTRATRFAAPKASADDDEDLGTPTEKRDGKGRVILFEKDLGGGKKKFTWVKWSDWNPSDSK
jgi:hypothetical protein